MLDRVGALVHAEHFIGSTEEIAEIGKKRDLSSVNDLAEPLPQLAGSGDVIKALSYGESD